MASVRSVGAAGTAWEPRAEESRAMYLIRERFFRLGEDSEITDEHGQPMLQVDGKVLSMRNRLVLRDPGGREVAQVHRKLVAMRPTYRISITGQQAATVSKRWFSMRDTYAVDVAAGQDDLLILASVLALDLAEDQERQQR
jgi:uncharacterized protein YxjI